MFLETYSSKCKTAIADINKLKIEYEILPLTDKTPFWMAKGSVGPFQYRSLGVVYPETKGDAMRVNYNNRYREFAERGCIHTANRVMSSLQYDPEFGELYDDANQFNNIFGNTQVFRSTKEDFPVINEYQQSLQQIGSLIDRDIFNVIEENGQRSAVINIGAFEGLNVILPFLYATSDTLREYAQIAKILMQNGANSVVALYMLQIMPNSNGQEIMGKIQLPMPQGGISFSDLMNY